MPFLNFTVDAALLQELGERLVGRPYIALAELVKNGYDADARRVTIEMNLENDCIKVRDDGHGMDYEEFKDFWMRIGSIHKKRQRLSRNLKRPLTGSKGIGRLAVQYLARELELSTTSEKNLHQKLNARVKWEEAVRAGDLTQATVEYQFEESDGGFAQGTEIILKRLKQEWNADFVQGLAREIWWLQPPFRNPLVDTADPKKAFEIDFVSEQEAYKRIFNAQLNAIADLWITKLVGKNVKGEVTLSLQYKGESATTMHYSCGLPWTLQDGNFEIRIFNLKYRQPYGITVQEARNYLNEYGGVHVYDAGFHLPYYGDPRNDWLKIEFDSSHRLSISKLLPEDLQVPEGMMLLPTLSRIFGVVNVDTAKEPDLEILITRDRFKESTAFANLRDMVRWALDFYATREKLRSAKQEKLLKEIEKPKTLRVEEVLDKYRSSIPQDTFEHLRKDVEEVMNSIETEAEVTAKRVGLMGSLATAGISALAYQHETKSQFHTIEEIIEEIGGLAAQLKEEKLRQALTELKESLSLWVERARATNALFSLYAYPENIQTRKRFLARKVVDEIRDQVKPLARGTQIETSRLNENLLLPKASLAEWSSIFQNVFINAFNALLDSKEKLIDVCSRIDGVYREILFQDTGCGVNLKDAEELFKPFVRKMEISPERRALGYGGTGLGLTIVRMIAHNIACEVSFVEPEKGFNTAFSLRWRETE